jgi:hypothetical protein
MTKREVIGVVLGVAAIGALLMAWPSGAATGDLGPSSAQQINRQGEARVDESANTGFSQFQWCPGVAVTTLSDAQELTGRKSITFQNETSTACFVTFDAQAPVTSGALGIELPASSKALHEFPIGDNATVKVACAAALSSPSCLQILQVK